MYDYLYGGRYGQFIAHTYKDLIFGYQRRSESYRVIQSDTSCVITLIR